jgi:hypothetical protein
MSEQEKWYSDEIRKTFCKERYSTTSHHYFFELKEAKNGSKYIVIDQRKKVGSEFVGAKIRIFADEMLGFQRVLDKLIQASFPHQSDALDQFNQPPAITPLSPPASIPVTASCATPIITSPVELNPALMQPGLLEKAKARLQRLWGRTQSKMAPLELQPMFFEKLITTNNWQEFEEYTYYLLKLIGIQNVYHFLGERQAGRADGFLKTGNLAIVYDCTLRTGMLESDKQEQINNYCAQLQRGVIDLAENIKEEFYQHKKQVWIITRGTTRLIKIINAVEVKEIHIFDLIALYQERLLGNMSQQLLEMRLHNL